MELGRDDDSRVFSCSVCEHEFEVPGFEESGLDDSGLDGSRPGNFGDES